MSFSNSFKDELFNITDRNFNEKALELFNYQAKNNLVYKNYLQLLKVNPSSVSSITEIPFLPIQFFKTQKIITDDFSPEVIFYSSGTTGEERSQHYVKDLSFYKSVSRYIFSKFYGPLENFTLLALLPSYLENKSSSLIYMINHFTEESGNVHSGFVLNDFKNIEKKIGEARAGNSRVILWGVSYALLDLAEQYPMDLSDCIVLETGGMKGRRKEMVREDLHQILKENFKAPAIHSEYGMTELLSQAYSAGEGLFSAPSWMKILIRELHDPLALNATLGNGGINIIDLANVDSCAFIETQDVGRLEKNGEFEIRGRFDNSEIRGCNLLYFP